MRMMWLGFVFILAVFLLAIGVLVVENLAIFTSPSLLYVGFEKVEGLREGDDVRVEGVLFGKVLDIQLHDEGVLVICKVDKPLDEQLYKDYSIYVEGYSILGGSQISVDRGTASAGVAEPFRKEKLNEQEIAIYRGRVRADPFKGIGELVKENKDPIKSTVESIRKAAKKADETLGKVGEAVDEFKKTAETINAGEGTLGKLLTDDEVYRDLKDITGKINRGEGLLGRLVNDDSLYEDLRDVTTEMKKTITDVREGKGLIGRLLYDDVMAEDVNQIIQNLKATSKDLYDIVHGIKEGEGTIGKLFQEDDLYDEAKKTLEGIDKTLGRAARATAWLGGSGLSFGDTEHSIGKIFVRFEPDETKYFQAGAAFMSYSVDGDTVRYEDQIDGDDQLFIKAELFIAYRIPWILDNHLTVRAGLLEGKVGGALEYWREDWGLFEHRIDFTFEIRDAYNDLDDEDIDEEISGAMMRVFLKTPVVPKMDGWFAELMYNVKAYVGISRLFDNEEVFFGIGLEYVEEDIRTLIGLLGAGT